MEEENKDVIQTKNNKGSYLTGIIGAIIGGAIATIPWVLVYVYGGMMLSILAALIAAGEFYGYKICKGKINKKLPAILMILAVIIVTIVTLLVIPSLLLRQEGIAGNLKNIEIIYQNTEFKTAIIKDFMVSVVFTILGASIITANIKRQIENGNSNNIKLNVNNTEEVKKAKNDAIELIKPIFKKYDAVTKEKAIMKEEVLAEIEEDKNGKTSFNYLVQLGLIKKYKSKYYYVEENEQKQNSKKKNIVAWIVVIICIAIIVVATIFSSDSFKNSETYKDTNISFEISTKWKKYESEYDNQWNFYRYINTQASLDNTIGDKEDYSSYPAVAVLFYDKVNKELINTIEDVKRNLEEKKDEYEADLVEITDLKTNKGYSAVKVKIVYESDPQEIVYYYYILKDDKLACLTLDSYSLKDDKELEKEANNIINSLEWL